VSFYLIRKMIRKLSGIVIRAVSKPEPVLKRGFGSREIVGKICADAGYKSVLIVTDKTVYSLGYHDKILNSLKAYNYQMYFF